MKYNVFITIANAATLYVRRRNDLPGTFSFGLLERNLYVVVGSKTSQAYDVVASLDNNTKDFDMQSAFILKPYATGDDLKKNCPKKSYPGSPQQPVPERPQVEPTSKPGTYTLTCCLNRLR